MIDASSCLWRDWCVAGEEDGKGRRGCIISAEDKHLRTGSWGWELVHTLQVIAVIQEIAGRAAVAIDSE